MFFLIIFAIVFLILGIVKKKSKFVFVLQNIVLWILMGWNSGGMDFSSNEIIYSLSGKVLLRGFNSGWLYNLIAYFFHVKNRTFIEFNIFLYAAGLIMLSYVIFKETEYPCLVMNLFLINPFLEAVIQKRFFWGMVFIILGLYFLKMKKSLLYLFFVFCAMGIHFSFVIFFPFILWNYIDEKKEIHFIRIGILLELFVVLLGRKILALIIMNSKLETYIYDTTYSSSIVGIMYCIAMFIYWYLGKEMYQLIAEEDNNRNLLNFLKRLNNYVLLLVPLCYFESVFLRYYRIVLIWNYIFIANELGISKHNFGKIILYKRNLWMYVFILYTVILTLIIYNTSSFGLSGYLETVLTNVLFE